MRRLFGKLAAQTRGGATPPPFSALPVSLPDGAKPNGNWEPDVAGRERFLDRHIFMHTHIPKTGGSTVSHALAAIVGATQSMDIRLKRTPDSLVAIAPEDRAHLRFVSGHFPWGRHTLFDRVPLYIAAVREPVARAISYYGFVKRNPGLERAPDLTDKTFEEAWDLIADDPARQQSNEQTRFLCGLKVDGQTTEEAAFQQIDTGYFLVLPTHRIGKAISFLRAAFGVPNAPLPNANRSPEPAAEISPAMRAKIEAANAVDAAVFEKVSDEFPERIERAAAYIAKDCLRPNGARG